MANLRKQVDMGQGIARFIESLLRLLLPASGRRRSCGPSLARQDTVAVGLPLVPVLRGEDIGLVRPYLVAHERRQEERRQRARGRVLWLAVSGVDIGPRVIHGVGVTAR
ncbi:MULTISPECIES: hypothetical protein [Streptomyces]|uniref:hypothetical protein n=1 Tax=Streptomyces TaxID=1883 RepID=UPI001F50407A|nr:MULTISPECIES: hypothetical protein [Streptomyces]WUD08025.1 hypothetical protein OG586_18175 [Streptomyces murinus]